MKDAFGGNFNGMKVLVTGHTGFKGSWLTLWLQELGAHVIGYSLPPPTTPSNFSEARVQQGIVDIRGDVRDYDRLLSVIQEHQPIVIFHLAAQSLVLHGYAHPKETFDVNAGGTVNILEAARHSPSVKAIVVATTDKCYENKEWLWGYRENDDLGGQDPYSASKSMAEQAVTSYNKSFFNKTGQCAVASVRAGNVIGGGDFSDNRIVPDCMKALMQKKAVIVRNPKSVRPWLNVLDPLSGYLWLGVKLLDEGQEYAGAWNFGPLEHKAVSVETLVTKAIELWGCGEWNYIESDATKPEMGLLRLNWDKAANLLHWRPTYNWEAALQETVDWFKEYEKHRRMPGIHDMRAVCLKHIRDYVETAAKLDIEWAVSRSSINIAMVR